MIECSDFYELLASHGVTFFTGVPDSLLKDFCAYVTDHTEARRNVIAANEGNAIALAAGHYLATGRLGLVYMQNSGLGNAVNPLTSLMDPDVYGIPALLIVGWRGEPGHKDEPQHVKMGKVTRSVLEAAGVPHAVLPDEPTAAAAALAEAVTHAMEHQTPYALVVRRGTFAKYKLQSDRPVPYEMAREQALEGLVRTLPAGALVVSTTGMPSRELFELRERLGQPHDTDFLTVGSMGHSSQIALGVALATPDRPVYCIDGDGAYLMHAGGAATIASLGPANYRHVVLNNGAHDSVGGQPTVAFEADLAAMARASGYERVLVATTEAELAERLAELHAGPGPVLLEVRVRKGARPDIGRPTMTPRELKERFMGAIRG